jgi:hypothetical protein
MPNPDEVSLVDAVQEIRAPVQLVTTSPEAAAAGLLLSSATSSLFDRPFGKNFDFLG